MSSGGNEGRASAVAYRSGADRFEELIEDALGRLAVLKPEPTESVAAQSASKRALDVALLSQAALDRGVQVKRFSDTFLILEHNSRKIGYFQNMCWTLSVLDRVLTNDKQLTKHVLRTNDLPVASGLIVHDVDSAIEAFRKIGPPVAVKPIVGSGGKGVTVDVRTETELRSAARLALKLGRRILVEESISSIDLRIMVVEGRAVASMLRVPANVLGDGTSTIKELITAKNELRTANSYLRHVPIEVNDATAARLTERGLSMESVPSAGQRVFLHYKANLGAGGDSYEITGLVHPSIVQIAERAANGFATAHHAGIDLLVERFDEATGTQRVVVCEVNLNNDLPIHVFPLYGRPIDTAAHSIRSLFFAPRRGAVDHSLKAEAAGAPRSSVALPLAMHSAEVLRTLATPARRPERLVAHDVKTPRELDRALLAEALERHGFTQIRFSRRLIYACHAGREIVIERTGSSVFIDKLGQRDDALAQLLEESGIPSCQARRYRRRYVERAEEHLRRLPGPWTIEPAPPGSPRRPILVRDLNDLRSEWNRLAQHSTRLTVARATTDLTCIVLLVQGQHLATQIVLPAGVIGDVNASADELSRDRNRTRSANPFFRLLAAERDTPAGAPQHLTDTDLSWTPLDLHADVQGGGDTIGYAACPFTGLADSARTTWDLVGRPPLLAVYFAALSTGSSSRTHTFAVSRIDPDPVLAQFAFPLAGDSVDVYGAVARVLIHAQRYLLD